MVLILYPLVELVKFEISTSSSFNFKQSSIIENASFNTL